MFLSQLESKQVFNERCTCVGAFTRVQQASLDILCHIFIIRLRCSFNTQNVRWIKMVTKIWRLDYSQLTTFRKSVLSPVVFNKWLAVVRVEMSSSSSSSSSIILWQTDFIPAPSAVAEEQQPTSADENGSISATLCLLFLHDYQFNITPFHFAISDLNPLCLGVC